MASTAASMVPRPVRRTTGQSGSSSFSARSSHSPSVSGIARSERTTSGPELRRLAQGLGAVERGLHLVAPERQHLRQRLTVRARRRRPGFVRCSREYLRSAVVKTKLRAGPGQAAREEQPAVPPRSVELHAELRTAPLQGSASAPPARSPPSVGLHHLEHHPGPRRTPSRYLAPDSGALDGPEHRLQHQEAQLPESTPAPRGSARSTGCTLSRAGAPRAPGP